MTNNTNNQQNVNITTEVTVDTLYDNSDEYAKIPIIKGQSLIISAVVLLVGILLIVATIYFAGIIGATKTQFIDFMSYLPLLTIYGTVSIIVLRYGYVNIIYRMRYIAVKKKAKQTKKTVQECYVEIIAVSNNISKKSAYKALIRKGRYLKMQKKLEIYNNIDL